MPSLLVRLFLLTYQKDRLPVDHVEVQQTYNVQLNREGKHWRTKRYLWYSIHRFGVCLVRLHIYAPSSLSPPPRFPLPLSLQNLSKEVAPRYSITILRKFKSCNQKVSFNRYHRPLLIELSSECFSYVNSNNNKP